MSGEGWAEFELAMTVNGDELPDLIRRFKAGIAEAGMSHESINRLSVTVTYRGRVVDDSGNPVPEWGE